jgi:hypothetical protein
MTLIQRTVNPASVIGGALGPGSKLDAGGLTDTAGCKRITIACPAFTQNQTVVGYGGALGFRAVLIGAYFVADTLPAGGTLAVNVIMRNSGADLTMATGNPEAATAKDGFALTLDATNKGTVHAATDSIIIDTVSDNNTVGTAHVGGVVTLLFAPLEPTTGSTYLERS